jgi:hypothetical protein
LLQKIKNSKKKKNGEKKSNDVLLNAKRLKRKRKLKKLVLRKNDANLEMSWLRKSLKRPNLQKMFRISRLYYK